MGNKRIEVVSESMFCTLMAFLYGEYCGAEMACMVEEITKGRVRWYNATLYTILGRFEEEGILMETCTERLTQCLADAAARGDDFSTISVM